MGDLCGNGRDDRDRVCQLCAASYHGRGRSRDVDGGGGCAIGWTGAMIPLSSGVRVWLATGQTPVSRPRHGIRQGGIQAVMFKAV